MKTLSKDILDSKAVKIFIRGLLVIIGLFGFLSYVIAALLLYSGMDFDCKVFLFILILPILPIVVLLLWFFLFANKKPNESASDIEDNSSKKQMLEVMGNTFNLIARAIKPDSEKTIEVLQKLLIEMPEMLSKIRLEDNPKQTLISDSSNGEDR